MVIVYVALIIAGRKTYAQVPANDYRAITNGGLGLCS